jgi:hypothetical protein
LLFSKDLAELELGEIEKLRKHRTSSFTAFKANVLRGILQTFAEDVVKYAEGKLRIN